MMTWRIHVKFRIEAVLRNSPSGHVHAHLHARAVQYQASKGRVDGNPQTSPVPLAAESRTIGW